MQSPYICQVIMNMGSYFTSLSAIVGQKEKKKKNPEQRIVFMSLS